MKAGRQTVRPSSFLKRMRTNNSCRRLAGLIQSIGYRCEPGFWHFLRLWSIMWITIDSMETIQIVLDKKLLQAADQAARLTRRNRSALMRDALREHLRRLEVRGKEERDRQGYSKRPPKNDESRLWEAEATWPAE